MSEPIRALWTMGKRTPERQYEVCECEWDGRHFEAEYPGEAAHPLCRLLVEAGCPDGPMEVFNLAGWLLFTLWSIHEAAKWNISSALARGRFVPLEDRGWGKPTPEGDLAPKSKTSIGGEAL